MTVVAVGRNLDRVVAAETQRGPPQERFVRSWLIHPGDFNAGVISLQNLVDRITLSCKSVCANLAHADAMAQSASDEYETYHAIVRAIDAIKDKQLFVQTKS